MRKHVVDGAISLKSPKTLPMLMGGRQYIPHTDHRRQDAGDRAPVVGIIPWLSLTGYCQVISQCHADNDSTTSCSQNYAYLTLRPKKNTTASSNIFKIQRFHLVSIAR